MPHRPGVSVRRGADQKPLPLTLGHEIAGTVAAAGGEARLESGRRLEAGMEVIIPAVLPCGECNRCRAGRENICARQLMPGNDLDGGFATHITVPARCLVPVEPCPPGTSCATSPSLPMP